MVLWNSDMYTDVISHWYKLGALTDYDILYASLSCMLLARVILSSCRKGRTVLQGRYEHVAPLRCPMSNSVNNFIRVKQVCLLSYTFWALHL